MTDMSHLIRRVDLSGDLGAVNAARISMDVWVDEMRPRDARLIDRLVTDRHTSTLYHGHVSFRVEAPIFVIIQWLRHRVGMDANGVSGRYVEWDETSLGAWVPDEVRSASASVKQGSGGPLPPDKAEEAREIIRRSNAAAFAAYRALIELKVAKEIARTTLPQGMMTRYVFTGSLFAWSHFCSLRLAPDAQAEIRVYAQEIDRHMAEEYPVAWAALRRDREREHAFRAAVQRWRQRGLSHEEMIARLEALIDE